MYFFYLQDRDVYFLETFKKNIGTQLITYWLSLDITILTTLLALPCHFMLAELTQQCDFNSRMMDINLHWI